MKNCPKCAKRNEDKAKFCFNCGLNFGKHFNETSGKKEYCEKCGTKLLKNAVFCTECGTKVEKEPYLPLVDGTDKNEKKAILCINEGNGKTPEELYEEKGFIVEKGVLIKYIGREKNVIIPNGIKKIGESAFYHCTSVEGVVIPSDVKNMGKQVFKDCENLKAVQLGDGITEIPENTFFNCSKLEKINIPRTVTKIGKFAFTLCYGLSKFEIPQNVTRIENYSFSNCRNLKTIKVPKRCSCENDWLHGTPADIIYY